jgi:hypothetical protein
MTTMPVFHEPEVLKLLKAPDGFALATLMVMGEPRIEITRLSRGRVSSFTTLDTFEGTSLEDPTR